MRRDTQGHAQAVAVGLGWFSIGLGAVELLFAGTLARALGMKGREAMIRAYGAREIANGLGLLAAKDRAPWLWGRVAGDALDMATLAAHVDGNDRKESVALALGAVAGVAALDVYAATALSRADRPGQPARDYSDRTGLPLGAHPSRGAALRDFQMPRDMATPQPMRPWVH